jgi:hypothetical protein
VTETSKAIAKCKEMLVIPLNNVVDKNRIVGKRSSKQEERHKGSLTQKRIASARIQSFMSASQTIISRVL